MIVRHTGIPPNPSLHGADTLATCRDCGRTVTEGDDPVTDPDDLGDADAVVPCRVYADDLTVEDLKELLSQEQGQDGNGDGATPIPIDGDTALNEDDPQRDQVADLARQTVNLFHRGHPSKTWLTAPFNGHKETWRIDSDGSEHFLRLLYHQTTGKTPSQQAITDAQKRLSAIAYQSGPRADVHRRVAMADDRVYIDRGTDDWDILEVGPGSHGHIDDPPVNFTRDAPMGRLPSPERGDEGLALLREYLPLNEDDDWVLTVCWMLKAWYPKGSYPIQVLTGPPISGKSTMAEAEQRVLDPKPGVYRPRKPKSEEDLYLYAQNAHVVAYDNISTAETWFSDGISNIATGGGFRKRELYTSEGESVIKVRQPIILNGIGALVRQHDLRSRALPIELNAIPEDERRSEERYWRAFKSDLPEILGGLCDTLSYALRHLDSVDPPAVTRMVETVRLGAAAEEHLGWEPGTVVDVFESLEERRAKQAQAADELLNLVTEWFQSLPRGHEVTTGDRRRRWVGTSRDLRSELVEHRPDAEDRDWFPGSPAWMGRRIKEMANVLEETGITYRHEHKEQANRHVLLGNGTDGSDEPNISTENI